MSSDKIAWPKNVKKSGFYEDMEFALAYNIHGYLSKEFRNYKGWACVMTGNQIGLLIPTPDLAGYGVRYARFFIQPSAVYTLDDRLGDAIAQKGL